jgi:hypothetical protein
VDFKDRAIAQNVQIQAREQQNQQQPVWEVPPTLSWGAGISLSGAAAYFLAYKIYDRFIKPRQYAWFAKMRRPYEDMEAIANGLQTIRGETGAERAVLMEVDSKRGTMISLAQEVLHAGVAKIIFSARDNQADCVKKILQRFNDDLFINRETENITDAEQYQGFLNNYGVAYVIYYKVGERDSTAWILALHFSYIAHVDYMAALDLRQRIKQVCSSMLYLLLQRSPVEGLIK